MKKEIRITDQKRGLVQVTIADERWYMRQSEDKATGLPIFKAVPSVTWIAGHYPKGLGFYKWLAEKGWDESQAIKVAAGDRGSKVHEAISAILAGQEVRIDSKFMNRTIGRLEELTLEEVDAIKSFVDWKRDTEVDYVVESIIADMTLFSDQYNYAGTLDWLVRLTPKAESADPLKLGQATLFLVDFKTSKQIWREYEMQVSAYRVALENGENPFEYQGKQFDVSGMKMAILQVGYNLNRAGYKWTVIEDKFDLFLTAQKIWAQESGGQSPKVKDYPIVLAAGTPLVQEEMEIDPEKELVEIEGEIPEEVAPVSPLKAKKAAAK